MDSSSTPLKTMKAVVQTEIGGPETLKIGDVPFPVPNANFRNLRKEKLSSKYSTLGSIEQTPSNAEGATLLPLELPISLGWNF